jgi:hypothetical protein
MFEAVSAQLQYKKKCNCLLPPRSMGLLGVARANTAVGVSPETYLLLLLQRYTDHDEAGFCLSKDFNKIKWRLLLLNKLKHHGFSDFKVINVGDKGCEGLNKVNMPVDKHLGTRRY